MGETEKAAQAPAADDEETPAAAPAQPAPSEPAVAPDEAKVPGPNYDA